MKLTYRLLAAAADIWRGYNLHPFVLGFWEMGWQMSE